MKYFGHGLQSQYIHCFNLHQVLITAKHYINVLVNECSKHNTCPCHSCGPILPSMSYLSYSLSVPIELPQGGVECDCVCIGIYVIMHQ